MKRTDTSVDEFLRSFEEPRASDLAELDALIHAELFGCERVLWEGVFWGGTEQRIIGYGTLLQPRPRGKQVEWMLIGLAAQKQHLSVYVNAVESGEYLVRNRAATLGNVKVGASALTFKKLEDLDLDAFRSLLRRALELSHKPA